MAPMLLLAFALFPMDAYNGRGVGQERRFGLYVSDQYPASVGQSMEQLLEGTADAPTLQRGDVVEGVVMHIEHDSILVSIGHKAEGVIPGREMRNLSSEELLAIQVGNTVVCTVLRPESEESPAILSLDLGREEVGWRTLESHLQTGELLEAKIVGANRGGALVQVEGTQGFVPLSHLVLPAQGSPEGESPAARRVGETVKLKVLEVDRRRKRVILSERVALQERRQQNKEHLLEELREGEVRAGRISGIAPFGAFVDLGGADGLIHISELSWGSVKSPEEVVHVGDEVQVQVLKVDREQRRIALSLRRLLPEPWATVTQRYYVGQLVTGTVTKLAQFGAFAKVEEGVEGLIHISELGTGLIHHPREAVQEGDVVTLKILSIDPERRRLGLSLKEAEEELRP